MKSLTAVLAAMLPLLASALTDVYAFRMTLHVPRVYDNAQSTGYRKYQTQRLEGELRLTRVKGHEPEVGVIGLRNRTHKVGGACVTYETTVDGVVWHVIGNNWTGKFNVPSMKFEIDADPSYNVGADEPDNTLLLTLAGKGTGSGKALHGYATGQIGCGCYAYGHRSPTRLFYDLGTVVDTASVWGTWRAIYKRTEK